jgi:hypothetical protein
LTKRARFLAIACVAACASTPTPSRVEVGANPRALEGTIAVATTFDSKGCQDRECVEADAVRALLFMGVPGSTIPRAMVANEQEARQSHKEFFTDLFEKKGFAKYVVRVDEEKAESRQGDKRWNVIINSDALRRALESAGVVRKFGY